MPLVIDAHQHFWDRDRHDFDHAWQDGLEPLERTFLPPDLEPLLAAAGVDRTVFVQTQHNIEENRWVLQLADEYPFIVGVVGWVDLASEDCEEQVLEFKQHPKFVGVRHIVHDEPDDDFIVRPEILRGLSVLERHRLPYDLLFYVRHLRHAATLGERFPELPMVIDHLSKPEIKQHRVENWIDDLRAAAAFPNIFCKLSGMVTEADWDSWRSDDLRPYVQATLETFGPRRCMFGSDWPVCLLAGSYQQVFEALQDALGPLSDSDRAEIFGGTATRFYGLAV